MVVDASGFGAGIRSLGLHSLGGAVTADSIGHTTVILVRHEEDVQQGGGWLTGV